MLQEADGHSRPHDFDIRIDLQELFDASRMIWLRVIYDYILDVLNRRDLRHRIEIFVEKLCLSAFKQRRLFAALQHIGIVGGSEFRIHDNVKHAQILIQHADPIETVV